MKNFNRELETYKNESDEPEPGVTLCIKYASIEKKEKKNQMNIFKLET